MKYDKKYTKSINQIYETNNLEIFKIIDSNRDFTVRQNLVADLKQYGKFEYPIMVNEFYEVIDGQHRLAASKFLQLPIQYFINKGATKETVKRINTNSKNWSLTDFVKSYAEEGLPDYVQLQKNLNDPRASCLTNSSIMSISTGSNFASDARTIRERKYKINNNHKTDEFFDFISKLSARTEIKTFKDKAAKSIFHVWSLDGVDKQRLFDTLTKLNIVENLKITHDQKYLTPMVVKEYNKRLSNIKKIKYHYNDKEEMIFDAQK